MSARWQFDKKANLWWKHNPAYVGEDAPGQYQPQFLYSWEDEENFTQLPSYPFLAIAKHYGYPYADVLLYADSIRLDDGRHINEWPQWNERVVAARRIVRAVREFERMQSGAAA